MNSCRIFDIGIGICIGHTVPIPMVGIIMMSASTKSAEYLQSARTGDMILGFCGHPGIIMGGSPLSNVEGLGSARIGDSFGGIFSGVLALGSGTHITGG